MFLDLFNLSTFLIPRQYIPSLSMQMKHRLLIMEDVIEMRYRRMSFGKTEEHEGDEDDMKEDEEMDDKNKTKLEIKDVPL